MPKSRRFCQLTPKFGKIQRIGFLLWVGKTLSYFAAALRVELKARLHAATPFGGANARIEFVHCALHVHGERTAEPLECFEVSTS
jgi:hypothetical protein